MEKNIFSGVLSMLISAMCVALTCFLGKALSENLSLSLLVFIRFFFPLLLTSWAITTIKQDKISFKPSVLHVVRAVFAILGQYCLFYTLSYNSVLLATLLFSTGPLFVPLISYITNKSVVNRSMLISIFMGFLGVVCVIHPGNESWSPGLILGLGAGFFNACSQVTFHKISQKKAPLEASFYLFSISSIVASIPMLVDWFNHADNIQLAYTLDSDLLLILILFSISSMSNQMFRSKAYSFVKKPSILAPFWYASIPFSAGIDWLAHGVLPDEMDLIGCLLIILGGYLMTYFKEKLNLEQN